MKWILFVFATLAIHGASAQEYDQVNIGGAYWKNALHTTPKNSINFIPAYPGNINAHAVEHFKKQYPEATNVSWANIPGASGDNQPAQEKIGYVCWFMLHNINNRAYYDKSGSWQYTIAGYGEDKLPKEIRNMVKSIYYDYSITFVNEINMTKGEPVYLVQLQDETSMKTVRVSNDEIDVLEELSKSY